MSARALYSDSVDDLDTVHCLRAVHEIKLEPRYIANRPVDRRSSEHPAQSASEKAVSSEGEVVDGC